MAAADCGDRGDERARPGSAPTPTKSSGSASTPASSSAVETETAVGGEPVEQVVGVGALLAHREGDGDRVLLDDLVGRLATDAGPHRGDQHLGGGEERQVAPQLALDDRRVGAEVVEHGASKVSKRPSTAKNASGRATRRTTEQLTSPSFHWSPASAATIVRWPRSTVVKPLMRSQDRVFILWGMADEPTWPAWKPSVTSSWPAISRMVRARLDGAAAACTSAATTSRSSDRGYT